MWTNDSSFLNRYLSSPKSLFLENRLIAEYFTANTYFSSEGVWFRALQPHLSEPVIAPLLSYSTHTRPGALLGGTALFDLGLSSISSAAEKTRLRFSFESTWSTRQIYSHGLVLEFGGNFRLDHYSIDHPAEQNVRILPQAFLTLAYPLIAPSHTHLLEPQIQIFLAPYLPRLAEKFNRESFEPLFNADYLFAKNHWIGNDVQEIGPRVTYALAYHWYRQSPAPALSLLFGQHFTQDRTFPQASALNDSSSDYAGKIEASFSSNFQAAFSFLLDNRDFSLSERTALISIKQNSLRFQTIYTKQIYPTVIEGAAFSLTLEPSSQWQSHISYRHQSGPYQSALSLGFRNECLRFSVNLTRDYQPTSDVRVGFRLEFSQPSL